MSAELQRALALVKSSGFVAVTAKSYRASQGRQRIAKCMELAERDRREGAEAWARDCCAEERRVRERLTFVYGVARAHGASVRELSADPASPVPYQVDGMTGAIGCWPPVSAITVPATGLRLTSVPDVAP